MSASAISQAPSAPKEAQEEQPFDLDARHRKEQRDLQARITQKKKQATKKTRKGVNDECERLEYELRVRQQAERDERDGTGEGTSRVNDGREEVREGEGGDDLAGAASGLRLGSKGVENGSGGGDGGGDTDAGPGPSPDPGATKSKKPNRQKARLARRAAEQEEQAEQAAKEVEGMTDFKAREQEVIGAAIEARGLVEYGVRSDGHCLYAAMADQLGQVGVHLEKGTEGKGEEGYGVVRREVADWVLGHPDDYLPFLDEEDMEKGIEGYARKIRETGEWGGQLEIAACARRWGLVVNVLQGDGRVERVEGGEAQEGAKECWLAYYKHSFGLGEHYNSLRKKV